jgi:cytoskeleton protein RodZ
MSASEHDGSSPLPTDNPPATASLGARFRAAREACGLGIDEVASRLRAPPSKIHAIESDDLDQLGAKVFARGYLLSYARLVGLPAVVVETALADREQPEIPLSSSVHVPRSRYLLDRYARRGAYLVLTASIVLPVVWLANREQLPLDQLGLRSLDAPVEQVADRPLPADGFESTTRPVVAPLDGEPRADDDDVTVMASLTPFSNQRPIPRSAAEEPAEPIPAVVESAAERGWLLRLRQDSWVEILDVDGRRLEYGLLPAGTERRYPADRVASVALGNALGAEWLRDGEAVDLAPFRRANVARFTVSSAGRLRPAGN